MKVLTFSILLLLTSNAFAQQKAPLGEWEGESVCQVPKPCTTEHVIYEIKQDARGQVTIKADKVVNGQREWMGDISCTWNGEEQRLNCPMTNVSKPADWVFWLKGDRLLGVLTIREGNVVFRKIDVRRKK